MKYFCNFSDILTTSCCQIVDIYYQRYVIRDQLIMVVIQRKFFFRIIEVGYVTKSHDPRPTGLFPSTFPYKQKNKNFQKQAFLEQILGKTLITNNSRANQTRKTLGISQEKNNSFRNMARIRCRGRIFYKFNLIFFVCSEVYQEKVMI